VQQISYSPKARTHDDQHSSACLLLSNALNCPCVSILHHAIGMSLGDLVLNEICAKISGTVWNKEN